MHPKSNTPKIFIGLREISGYYGNLKKGFDELGYSNVYVCLGYHHHNYEIGKNPLWATIINNFSQKIGKFFSVNWASRIIWIGLIQNIFGIFIFLITIFRYNVFIFGSVSTFFFFLELPILRLLGKTVIHVYNGTDSRPVYLNGYVIQDFKKNTIRKGIILTQIQKTCLWIIDQFANHIINIPPQSHFHTRTVINGYLIGFPFFSPQKHPIKNTINNANIVRILHAPSKPGPKGSFLIRDMIKRLKLKYNIDYIEISGRPNKEVLQELQKCDFVIDELYSDMPLAVFAVEAGFYGKPAVVGGYYSEHIQKTLSENEIPPSLFCLPNEMEKNIEKLIVDHELRIKIGNDVLEFVQKKWSPKAVAQRYIQLIEGSYPKEWTYNPQNLDYLEGCGFSQDNAKKSISLFLKHGGKSSLCLRDKPNLLNKLMDFAAGNS